MGEGVERLAGRKVRRLRRRVRNGLKIRVGNVTGRVRKGLSMT
jgi:hypothetical protein